MLFYILFFLSLVAIAGPFKIEGIKRMSAHSRFVMACVLVFMLVINRFNIGYDYNIYFGMIYPVLYPRNIVRFEFFTRLFMHAANILKSPFVFFFLCACVNFLLIFYIINKYSNAKYESLIIFVSLFMLVSLSTVRQGAAGAVLFFGLKYIREKKLLKYLIICIVAYNFHRSAIIGFLFYPLFYMKYRYVLFLAGIMVAFFYLLLPRILNILFPQYARYIMNLYLANISGNIMQYFYLFLLVYCILGAIIFKNFQINRGYLSIVTIGVLMPFVLGGHTGGRLAEYFLLYFILLFPSVNKKVNIHIRSITMIIFFIYFIIYLLMSIYVNESTDYVPYRLYFFVDKSELF